MRSRARVAQRRRDEVEPVEAADVAAEAPVIAGAGQLDDHLRRLRQVGDVDIIEAAQQLARVDILIERHQGAASDVEPVPDQVAREFKPQVGEKHSLPPVLQRRPRPKSKAGETRDNQENAVDPA